MCVETLGLYGVYALKTLHFGEEEHDRTTTIEVCTEMTTFGKLDEYNEMENWRHFIDRVTISLKPMKLRILTKKDKFWLAWEPKRTS